MSNRAQRRANRRNALLSTGPKTEPGKFASSQNNFRHGLTSQLIVATLSAEEASEFQELAAALRSEHNPQTPTEILLVERMTESFFMSSRAIRLQSAALVSGDDRRLALLLRYQTTHERAFFKSLHELVTSRKEAEKQRIGFESQKRKQEQHEVKMAAVESARISQQMEADLDAYLNAPIPGKNHFDFGSPASPSILESLQDAA